MTLAEKLSIEREEGYQEGIKEGMKAAREEILMNIMKALRCSREQAISILQGRPPLAGPSQWIPAADRFYFRRKRR